MVHSGKGKIVVEEFFKLFGKGGGELWTSIGDDLVIEPKAEVYFMEKKYCYPFGSDHFLCRAKNHLLSKAMVNHN